MKLWIDDDDWSGTRNPPSSEWTWAKTSSQALDILSTPGVVITEVSFDHDLGLTADCKDCGIPAHDDGDKCCPYCYHDDTTRRIVLWMIENNAFPPVIHIHSGNYIGRQWLQAMIEMYGPGVT